MHPAAAKERMEGIVLAWASRNQAPSGDDLAFLFAQLRRADLVAAAARDVIREGSVSERITTSPRATNYNARSATSPKA